jgi:DNA-directed RNA polymerase specialized sigma24 family protein
MTPLGELVVKAKEGSAEAQADLWATGLQAAQRVARAVTNSPADAEDAASEGLLRAFSNLNSFT